MSDLFNNTGLADIIELKNIQQTYNEGKSVVIKDLDVLIENKIGQGQFIAILGPSGCGKSTILRYIAGLQKPTSGDVLLYGKPLSESDRIGMVFQKYSSLPWLTVLENIELGLKFKGVPLVERRTKAIEMLRLVELDGHGNKYAQYPTLSGGQLQRVAIARSLLTNPRVLLMDEPFGALDIKTRLKMQDSLLRIWKELSKKDDSTTVMFVTHDISEAIYLADEIWVMSKAPAQITKRIQVPFTDRAPALKKTAEFQEMINKIEDVMMQ
jgi:NitT/TauT family transport system ATP-binding protein